jgi:hypothetical protein
MLGNEEQSDFSHGRSDGACLLNFIVGIMIISDHLAQAAHLTLDAVQSQQQRLLLFRSSHNMQTII